MVIVVSKPVSRVLSWTIIYLVRTLPHASMPPWGNEPGRFPFTRTPHCGVAPDRVYRIPMLPWESVSSYLAFPPLPRRRKRRGAVFLCCTFPEVAFGGRYPLSLPYGARTFLTRRPFGVPGAIVQLTHKLHYTAIRRALSMRAQAGPCMERIRSVSNSALHEVFEKCVKINKWDCKLHSFLVC